MNRLGGKSVCLLFSLLLAFACLAACGNQTNPSETKSETEKITEITTETETKPEPVKCEVAYETLHLVPYLTSGVNDSIVKATFEDKKLVLEPVSEGHVSLTFTNVYMEKASVEVVVNSKLEVSTVLHPFEPAANSMSVTDNGADPKGVNNSTEAFQLSIDRVSNMGGGVVYVPSGTYNISSISMKDNVTLKLAGFVEDVASGYTDTVKNLIAKGIFATIKTTGSSRNNIFVYNVVPTAPCTDGTSNFAISGGLIECESKMKFTAISCADGASFDHIIIRNIPNNHAFQIDGCKNVYVENIMFAGYTFDEGGTKNSTLTRETIQIEPTTPGSITSDIPNSPIVMEDGEYYHNYAITIRGCYFGPSDTLGSQLTPVGHHSVWGGSAVNGLLFENNVVDNPLYCGLHLVNSWNVTIRDNQFISNRKGTNAILSEDSALVSLYAMKSNATYTAASGEKIYYTFDYEAIGDRNIVIANNDFEIGGGTHLKAIVTKSAFNYQNIYAAYRPTSTTAYREPVKGEAPIPAIGYVMHQNVISNIDIHQNQIRVTGAPTYKDAVISLTNVIGLSFADNQVQTASGVSFDRNDSISGAALDTNVVGVKAETRYVSMAALAEKKVTIVTPTASVEVTNPNVDCKLYFEANEQGHVEFETDKYGHLTITVIVVDGYRFDGFKMADDSVWNPATALDADTTVQLRFSPIQ